MRCRALSPHLHSVIYSDILPYLRWTLRAPMLGRFSAAALTSALMLSTVTTQLEAASLTVFAAASVRDALEALAKRFEANTADKVIVSYGGSNALARQIAAGAPADVSLSAATSWLDSLAS